MALPNAYNLAGVFSMMANCINPSCTERFTYFGRGELVLKSSPVTGYQELFWMCERCAKDWQIPADLMSMRIASLGTKRRRAAA
jgi:hypothetical protein